MKREEKAQQTRRKIMDYALKEFSECGYSASSVNNMYDPEQGISKGIIYHYFASKEELFLACVRECFEQFKAYLQVHFAENSSTMSVEECLTNYFAVRIKFFHEYPLYQRIFMETVFMPQGHLKDEIDIYRQPIKEMNTKILEELLSRIPMRVSLDYHEVARIFIQILHFVELQYVTEEGRGLSIQALEEMNKQVLDILLNGIAERKDP